MTYCIHGSNRYVAREFSRMSCHPLIPLKMGCDTGGRIGGLTEYDSVVAKNEFLSAAQLMQNLVPSGFARGWRLPGMRSR